MRKMGNPLVVLLLLAVSLSCIIGNASAWDYTVISTDENGVSKNTFAAGETVYGYANTVGSSSVRLYVVEDRDDWKGGDTFTDVSDDSYETVIADGDGFIAVTQIWTPGSGDAGDYDVILDGPPMYGVLDGLDRIDCELGVGFSVNVPEFTTIAMPVGAILGLLFFFKHRKGKKE